jgi:hypothetical protein
VPWDWVVINGKMARCINPFVDLPDAADLIGGIVDRELRAVGPSFGLCFDDEGAH